MLIENAKLNMKLNLSEINKVICVVSDDDKLIKSKIEQHFDVKTKKQKIETVAMRRPRKVGQSFLSSVWTTIMGLINSINIVLNYKPKLCLTNGPAISVTISIAIRFLQHLSLRRQRDCRIIYIESFCRTKSLSLSGKLIYHLRLADEFYVQWPALQIRYPRTEYKGLLV